jgi:hypothetical protein
MATSCEDISARMMELLYGELPDADRASFEAHIAGCARCQAEREAFEGTRAMARGALDEPVPARAHAAILRAASEHLKTAAQATAAAATPAKARTSFWDWIRTRWTLPTLATVGAVAVVLIGSKVFLDPKKVQERGEQALAPEPAPVVEPLPASPELLRKPEVADNAFGGLPRQPASGPREEAQAELKKEVAGGKSSRKAGKTAARVEKDEAGPLGRLGGAASGSGSGMGAIAERRQFAPPPPPKAEKADERSDKARAAASDKLAAVEKSAPRDETSSARPAKGANDDLLAGVKSGGPTRKPAPEPRPGAAPIAAAPAPSAPSTASLPIAPPPPAAADAPPAHAKKAKRERASEPREAEGEGAATPAAGGRADSKPTANYGRGTGGAPEALIQRADRFYAEGRWNEAATAYRELLRIDPSNAAAGRWRQRFSLAQAQAEAAAREAAAYREAPSAAPRPASKPATTSDSK